MTRLGRNLGAYYGDTIHIEDVLREMSDLAERHGWHVDRLEAAPGIALTVLTRSAQPALPEAPRFYVSAGIHGDEPAGPLAVQRLLAENAFPSTISLWCCPCLNPTGFPRSTRAAASGIDLNRDYRHLRAPEIRTHVTWLQGQPTFDAGFCLHEDWEAQGFYVYELNPANRPSLAPAIIEAVRQVCPIDPSPMIDGRESLGGIIRPNLEPASRPEWPEAFYLIQNKAPQSYTLEAPSDFPLELRVAALATGLKAALSTYLGDFKPEDTPTARGISG